MSSLITFPIETSLMGIPKTQGIRSTSKLDFHRNGGV
jgi:Cu/Ag efflux pump CusA